MSDNPHAQAFAALEKLRRAVTDDHLHDEGRYFRDDYNDLTQCTHGETGNYRNRADGKAIAILWNLWKDGALSREGEDSAKVDQLPSVEELVATFKSAVDGEGSPLQMSFKGWAREQGYKILARAVISALAATRSGSDSEGGEVG